MFTSTDRFSQLLSLIQFVQIRFILIWLTSWDIHFNFFLLNDISKWIYHSKEHFEGSLKYFCQIGHYLQNNVMTKVKLKWRTSSVWVRCFDMCTNHLLFRRELLYNMLYWLLSTTCNKTKNPFNVNKSMALCLTLYLDKWSRLLGGSRASRDKNFCLILPIPADSYKNSKIVILK